jgi:hypothetical protein
MPAPTLKEYKSRLYMSEIDISIRMMTRRELGQFRKECPVEYKQWEGWQRRGCPEGEMVEEC